MLLYGNVVSVFSYFRVLLLLLCLRHRNTLTTGNLFLFVLFFLSIHMDICTASELSQ